MQTDECQPPVSRITLLVADLRVTERFFREGLGFLPWGFRQLATHTPVAGRLQLAPGERSLCWWLVGSNPSFEIELVQSPRATKRKPAEVRPCYLGYTRIGVHVCDFDTTLANLAELRVQPMSMVIGSPGQRRACVRNPDGIYMEIMEGDVLGAVQADRLYGAAMRSITVATPDFDASVAYFAAIAGHGPEAIDLHGSQHEALWGLRSARCKRAIFKCGGVLVEVVQYVNSAGKSLPAGHRIGDRGILSIAFGMRDKHDLTQVYQRVTALGVEANCNPANISGLDAVRVNDKLGFSVELIPTGCPAGDEPG